MVDGSFQNIFDLKKTLDGKLAKGDDFISWRKGPGSQSLQLFSYFSSFFDAMFSQSFSKFLSVAPSDLRSTETALQQPAASFAVRVDAALGLAEEARKELIDMRMEAAAQSGEGAHHIIPLPHQGSKVAVNFGPANKHPSPGFKEAMCNAGKVQEIGGSLEFFPLLFSVKSIDASSEKAVPPQFSQKVFSIRREVFAPENNMFRFNGSMLAGGLDLADKFISPFFGVSNIERLFVDVAKAIAEEDGMSSFGKVNGNAEEMARVGSLLKKLEEG